jgi:small subunit ribosomal protein S6
MQKNYELLYIVHPDLEGSTEKVTDKVVASITKADGKVTSQEDWGKRKLAYKIAKNDFGVYVLLNFTVDSEKLHLIERDIRLSEEILRSMVVAVPDIKELVPRRKKPVEAEVKAEEPASIIVAEDKPVKEIKKAAPRTKKVEEKTAEVVEETEALVEKKPAAKKAAVKKPAKSAVADEKERLKKLDEKLDELLK